MVKTTQIGSLTSREVKAKWFLVFDEDEGGGSGRIRLSRSSEVDSSRSMMCRVAGSHEGGVKREDKVVTSFAREKM